MSTLIIILIASTNHLYVMQPTAPESCEKEMAIALKAFQDKSPELEIKAKCVAGDILQPRGKGDV